MRRWLKTVVVSDEEKAHKMRQVGIRKANASESLMTCRNQFQTTSKPRHFGSFGMSLAGARLLARWCPAWRRREPDLRLLHGTWEGVSRHGRWDMPGGERECVEQQKLGGVEYRRETRWRTSS